jgi:hypothetical protein
LRRSALNQKCRSSTRAVASSMRSMAPGFSLESSCDHKKLSKFR